MKTINRSAKYRPRTLADILESRGSLGLDLIVEIALGILEALECLHSEDLLHADIKPANIIWVNGRPVLSDPGLVTPVGRRPYGGTHAYCPPEGCSGKISDDIYALGKVIYQMHTGRPARELDAYQLSCLNPYTETSTYCGLESIMAKACATDPAVRFQSAAEMKKAIQKVWADMTDAITEFAVPGANPHA
jgi:eukaryotic-like serine/threonine-protein kinase